MKFHPFPIESIPATIVRKGPPGNGDSGVGNHLIAISFIARVVDLDEMDSDGATTDIGQKFRLVDQDGHLLATDLGSAVAKDK